MTDAIQTNHLAVGYEEHLIVPDFNIVIPKHKITSVIGANGCGKSTILKAMGRIIPHQKGNIVVNGQSVREMKSMDLAKELSILPQSPSAPGTLSCYELVAYGRFPYQKGLGRLSKEDRKVIEWALSVTNMEQYAGREIASLSGGQRQRVWIAMALAQETGIILLDEPTTYLDLCHQLEILRLLKKLNQVQQTTIVMVLHDLNLAARYSDFLLAMKDGEIYHFGTSKEVLTKEMLAACFGIDGQIETDKRTGKPVCVSYDLIESLYEK